MFIHILGFEISYRLHRVSTYVYFAVAFFMAFFSVSSTNFGPIGTGKVLLNGPYAMTIICGQLTLFGSIIISAIFGTSILRDFQEDTYQLIFTKPVPKWAYLGGRWAGSLLVSVLIFAGLPIGALVGSWMPWADHERLAPFHASFYLGPFLSITVIQIFFLGSIFFLVAALTRRLMVVYLQGVVLFAIYLIGAIVVLNSQRLEPFWPSVLDPLGLVMLNNTTRYWTVVEKNTQLLGWSGIFLYNRLIWMGVGVAALASVFAFFPMSAEVLTAKGKGRRKKTAESAEKEEPVLRLRRFSLQAVSQRFDARAWAAQLVSLTKLRFQTIVKEIPFWALVFITIVLAVINGREAGRLRATAVWPVTYLMLQAVTGNNILWYVIATMYAGELVWRERDVRFYQIHDALPVSSRINWFSQFLAIAIAELLLFATAGICGILIQASRGYFHFELLLYFKELYLVQYPQLLIFTLFAFFCQTMLSNKFLGHGLVIGFAVLIPILYNYGFENRLYLIFETVPYTYSDMNGYGHFVPAFLWSLIYWAAFASILGVISIAFARRGTDMAWASRWKEATARWRTLGWFAAAFALVFVGSGVWFYYNTHVLNEFRTAKDQRKIQAAYERTFKKYEQLSQPKITAVDLNVDIVPERRSFSANGHYTLLNPTDLPISQVHVSNNPEAIDEIRFDRAAQIVSSTVKPFYRIYQLNPPLAPHESMRMDFRSSFTAQGFRDGNNRNEFAFNGTFFDADYFPAIGYNRGFEIDDPVRRREEGLPLQEELALPGDPYYENVNLFRPDSQWVTYHTVVSTSADQLAVAPGYLKKEWMQNGRRYFEYDMGSQRINNFFSYTSAKFALKRDEYKGVKLEIYYYPGHPYNLDRMLQSAKRGLDYFDSNFAPYQFQQFRILEYPRYRQFAQSFPNTVPYSEQLGFIQRVEKEDDIDMVYYVTAHELAHQWWGHQLVGGMTQGSNMMSETLAQYSALMVAEKEYGANHMGKFLKTELDAYLRGRGGETRKEPPLSLVQNEGYVWYNKGSLVMYALRDYLGEDRLNAALRKFLLEHRYATGPYPDTRQFVQNLRNFTPPELQSVITDLFESIILFDNKAITATWSALPDKKYKVNLTIETHKMKANGQGAETEVAMNDLVDVGVFSGDKENPKPLYLAKRRLTGKQTSMEFVVNEEPTRAGVDPYNKLIDRKPDDNVINVTKN